MNTEGWLGEQIEVLLGSPPPDNLQELTRGLFIDRYIADRLLLLAEEQEVHLRYFGDLLAPTVTWWFVAELLEGTGQDPRDCAFRVPGETLLASIDAAYRRAVDADPPVALPRVPSAESLRPHARSLRQLIGCEVDDDGFVAEYATCLATFAHDWALMKRGRRFLVEREPIAGSLADEYLQVAAGYFIGLAHDQALEGRGGSVHPEHIVRYELLEAVSGQLQSLPMEDGEEPRGQRSFRPAPLAAAPGAANEKVLRAPPVDRRVPRVVLTQTVGRHVMSGPMFVSYPFELLQGLVDELGVHASGDTIRRVLSPWSKRYEMLTRLVLAHGYELTAFRDFSNDAVGTRTVFLYHDVHVRDFIPAIGLAAENRRRGFSSTFFINWDFNVIDVFYRDAYRFFRNFVGEHAEVGFHGSPVSSWLCHEVFGGDEAAYFAWIDAFGYDEVSRFINRPSDDVLLFGKYREEDIVSQTEAWLERALDDMRDVFGDIRYMSHHGDNLAVLLSKHWGMLDPEHRSIFVARGFMTKQRLQRLGLDGIVASIARDDPRILRFDEGPNKDQYLEKLDAALGTGRTIFLLNHPWGLKEDDKRITYNQEFFCRRIAELEAS